MCAQFEIGKAKRSHHFEDLSINENVGTPFLKTKMRTRYNIYVSGGGNGGRALDKFLTRHTIEKNFLLMYMFSPTLGKSDIYYALSKMSHFGDLESSVTCGSPNRILRDAGTYIFKAHKTGTNVIANHVELYYQYNNFCSRLLSEPQCKRTDRRVVSS